MLISVRPFRGHLHPLIPLARAFRRAGHEVVVASAEDVAAILGSAGMTWLPAGFNPRDLWSLFPDEDPDYGYDAVKAKLDDLLEYAVTEFRPDVVVREPTDLAPALLAELIGAYSVIYGVAYFIPKESWHILGADHSVARLRREYNLPDDPELSGLFKDLYLSVLPPEFERFRRLPVPMARRVRYVPWDGDYVPLGRRGMGARPKVLVTLGTVYNTDADLFGRFLEAVAGEPYEVVCTLGEAGAAEAFGRQAENIHFEQYLAHSSVLPSCQAMLSHGGFNTMMGALAEGVPLVTVPLGSDQHFNARRCAENGVGLSFESDSVSAEELRNAVRRVLDEPSFRERAGQVRQFFMEQPSLPQTVRRIEMLTRENAPWQR